MTDKPARVSVRVDGGGWSESECKALAERCFERAQALHPSLHWPVDILFTDKATIQRLHAYFRPWSRPACILVLKPGEIVWPYYDYLGDIAIAFEPCRDDARRMDVAFGEHVADLLVQGMLDLADN